MSVIELTTFTVKPANTAALLAARPGMVDAFRRDRRGFIAARLIRVDDNTWLDMVEWTDDTAWDESRAKGANQPEIATFFATIDTLVSSTRGVRYDDPADRRVRTVAYGPHPAQVGELYLPDGDGPFPVVVLVHGGYWTDLWDRRVVTPLADALVREGYAVWNVEYRRIGSDGGWPGTFDDAEAAVNALVGLDPALDLDRVQVVGHSAGGFLAAWVAGQPNAGVHVVSAVSLAGILDVAAADADRFGATLAGPEDLPSLRARRPDLAATITEITRDGVVPLLFGGHRADVPERYARAVQPLTVPLLQVHGDADDIVPLSYANHPTAELHKVPNADHFDVIDPHHPTWPVIRDWLGAHLA
ncbi:hypothetical protein GCM10029964_078670 [Kibdelosporangium lantanae]